MLRSTIYETKIEYILKKKKLFNVANLRRACWKTSIIFLLFLLSIRCHLESIYFGDMQHLILSFSCKRWILFFSKSTSRKVFCKLTHIFFPLVRWDIKSTKFIDWNLHHTRMNSHLNKWHLKKVNMILDQHKDS